LHLTFPLYSFAVCHGNGIGNEKEEEEGTSNGSWISYMYIELDVFVI
jgi:hypothetical protein